jgi:hypothetical protein
VLLWLWDEDNSRTQEGESPPLEGGTQILVMESRPRGPSAYVESVIE